MKGIIVFLIYQNMMTYLTFKTSYDHLKLMKQHIFFAYSTCVSIVTFQRHETNIRFMKSFAVTDIQFTFPRYYVHLSMILFRSTTIFLRIYLEEARIHLVPISYLISIIVNGFAQRTFLLLRIDNQLRDRTFPN